MMLSELHQLNDGFINIWGGARNENGVRNPICNQVRLSDGTVVEHDVRLSPHIVARRIARRDVEADAWVEPLKLNVCRVARPSPSRAVSGLSPHKHTCAAGRPKKTPCVLPGPARKTHGAAENLRDPEGSHHHYWLKAFERSTGIAW